MIVLSRTVSVNALHQVWPDHSLHTLEHEPDRQIMTTKVCVVLTSSMVSIADQKSQIEKTKQILNGNRIVFTEVDCSQEENRATRDRYFEVSAVRGNYPQVFLQNEDGSDIKYIGSFNEIEQLNEMSDVPQEIIDANKLATLKSVFADVARR